MDDCLELLVKQYGLNVHILYGDSRTIEIDTGTVDLVLIDGDHTYEGTMSDFRRFGTRVRKGGMVVIDDVYGDVIFGNFAHKAHEDTAGRVVTEVLSEGEFFLKDKISRFAVLERK